jgi:acyl-CoA thioester hydrolase
LTLFVRTQPGRIVPYSQRMAIRFADIDALNHVNHAVVLTYAETIRCDWFAENGYPSMGHLPFIIASAHVEYKAPIPKSADLEVKMWTSRMGGKSWDFDYEFRDAKTGQVFATAKTVQVGYDYSAGKTAEPEARLKAKLQALTP